MVRYIVPWFVYGLKRCENFGRISCVSWDVLLFGMIWWSGMSLYEAVLFGVVWHGIV